MTDMNEVKRIAKTLLHTELHFDEKFDFIVHHPFFQNSFYYVQQKDIKMLNLNNRDELLMAREFVKEQIEKTVDVFDLFLLINKPYLPAFYKFAHKYMSIEDASKFLADMWVTVEFPNNDKNISPLHFIKLFKLADKFKMMNEKDLAFYMALPETIVVYRGVGENGKTRALSWTTDINVAKWFANRWDKKGEVYKAKINRDDVLACFFDRGEKEVVVDFTKLKEIEKVC